MNKNMRSRLSDIRSRRAEPVSSHTCKVCAGPVKWIPALVSCSTTDANRNGYIPSHCFPALGGGMSPTHKVVI